jgi:hypothetical protein
MKQKYTRVRSIFYYYKYEINTVMRNIIIGSPSKLITYKPMILNHCEIDDNDKGK